MTASASPVQVYCPHCHMPLAPADAEGKGPRESMRCPHCRLVVAMGRGIDRAHASDAPATGAAASIVGGAARRADGRKLAAAELHGALRKAALELDVAVARMRMIDYDELARAGTVDVTVADVLASSRSWKAACREAADAGLGGAEPV